MPANILYEADMPSKSKYRPIYLLSEDTYINKSRGGYSAATETSHVKKCFCAECNKLFDLNNELELKVNDADRSWYGMTISVPNNPNPKKLFEDIECPECGNKSFYSLLHRAHDPEATEGKINMNGAWTVPYVMRRHALYNITDDNGDVKSINDSMDLEQTIIYPSGKRFVKNVNFTETVDIENKNIYMTKSHISPSGEARVIYRSNSEDALRSVNNMEFEKNAVMMMSTVRGIKYRAVRDTSFLFLNNSFESDVNGGFVTIYDPADKNGFKDYKKYMANRKYATQYEIKCFSTEDMPDGYIDPKEMYRYNLSGNVFMSDKISGIYTEKYKAIGQVFKGKFNISELNEDNYLSADKSKLFENENDQTLSQGRIAAYNTFMVKYPAAFEYACQRTDLELNSRAVKTLGSKDIEATEENIDKLIKDLPDSVKSKVYRSNMSDIANQIYMCDRNIAKAIHDAKNSEEMISFMRYYAFGPDAYNNNIGEIKTPEHLKNKIYPSNELIQNDEELRAAFDKNPIGFANISYTAAKILRSNDKDLHYELTKALYEKTQTRWVTARIKARNIDNVNISKSTVLALNDPNIASLMTNYARLHDIKSVTDMYDNALTGGNIGSFYEYSKLKYALGRLNAEFVETPDEAKLNKAVTVDQFEHIVTLKEYLKAKGDKITNQDVLKQACVDFVDRFKERTPEIISNLVNNPDEPVYIKFSDGKSLLEHDMRDFAIEIENESKSFRSVVFDNAFADRLHRDYYTQAIKIPDKYNDNDGIVIDDMRFDIIRSEYDLHKYNGLVSFIGMGFDDKRIQIGVTDERTETPVCVFKIDDDDSIRFATKFDPYRNAAKQTEVIDSINRFAAIHELKPVTHMPVISSQDNHELRRDENDPNLETPGHYGHHSMAYDPVTGRNNDIKFVESDAAYRRKLAAEIYGVDDNNNIKVPEIKTPGE